MNERRGPARESAPTQVGASAATPPIVIGAPGSPPIALDLARAAYRYIPLYAPDFSPCPISLNDNTNRFGVPPAALRVLREAATDDINRYPAPFADGLKAALARYARVGPGEIATGCGSDDVIDSAIRAFSAPGDTIAFADPTFAMLPIFARMNGLNPVAVPLARDLDLDVDTILATHARIVYLCSPNNPTGVAFSRAAIERVVRESRGLVILDEAYAEFGGDAFLAEAPGHDRLLVTRTLSKAFGLSGLRIGYGAGNENLIREVEKSRGPFKVGGLVERAAIAALTEDLDWVSERVGELRENRARLIERLRSLGFAPVSSDANFVMIPVADAATTAAATRRAGVAVRPFPKLTGIGDAVRITVGPWTMMEPAIAALAGAPR